MAIIIYIPSRKLFLPKGQSARRFLSLAPSTALLFRQGSFFSLCDLRAPPPNPPPSHAPTRPSTKQGNTNRPLSGHIFLKTAGDGGSCWRSAFVNKSFTRPAEEGGWRGVGGKMVNKQTGWGVFMLRPPLFRRPPTLAENLPTRCTFVVTSNYGLKRVGPP